jgi:Ala-tRNA(Pro) deacylase
MQGDKLSSFLDENHVKYLTIKHSPAYTAQETAASAHVKGRNLAKTVIVKLDDKMVMAVLRGDYRIDLESLRQATEVDAARIAEEREFEDLFPDCETGAMPPFENLWEMPVYVDEGLTADEEIVFNAGTHSLLMQIGYKDFERLVHPTVVKFAEPRH